MRKPEHGREQSNGRDQSMRDKREIRHTKDSRGLRRVAVVCILLVLGMASAFGLEFTSRLTGVTTHPDFWAGVFPSSVRSFIGLEGLTILPGRTTEVGAEIATGTIARTITVNPLTGKALNATEDADIIANSSYDVMYASWKAGIAQGIGWSEQSQTDFLTLRLSLDGQWEVALDPLMQSVNRTGYPFSSLPMFDPAGEDFGTTLKGTPDLSGDRRLLSLSFDLYGKVNYLLMKTGSSSGIATEFKFTWAPSFLNLSKETGGVADFWKFWLYAQGGLMIHQAVDENGMNKWSIGLSDEFEMRIFGGDHIPAYAMTLKGRTWWYEPENMTFMARNVVKLDYYGQQFFGSCIPHAYAFVDLSFSGGHTNNIKDSKMGAVWAGSMGLHFELQMFGFMNLYYEIGRIFLYTGENPAYKPGYRLSNTLKISISVSGGGGIDWST